MPGLHYLPLAPGPPDWAAPQATPLPSRRALGWALTFGILRQHSVETAQGRELQGKAEGVHTDADEGHDARVLQCVQHAGLLPELGEVLHGICGLKVPQHGVCREQLGCQHCPAGPATRPGTPVSGDVAEGPSCTQRGLQGLGGPGCPSQGTQHIRDCDIVTQNLAPNGSIPEAFWVDNKTPPPQVLKFSPHTRGFLPHQWRAVCVRPNPCHPDVTLTVVTPPCCWPPEGHSCILFQLRIPGGL